MTEWFYNFLTVIWTTCTDVLPIAAIIIGFQLLVIRKPLPHPTKTALGFFYVLIGIAFFFRRVEYGAISAR
ncbi:DUF1538 family protein [Methylocucumis oryzae]|uniref:DUF1538 family protein n=1 Tax=Methylocucumis oryzae TaxID=1632867 RepID=UPI000AEF89A8